MITLCLYSKSVVYKAIEAVREGILVSRAGIANFVNIVVQPACGRIGRDKNVLVELKKGRRWRILVNRAIEDAGRTYNFSIKSTCVSSILRQQYLVNLSSDKASL